MASTYGASSPRQEPEKEAGLRHQLSAAQMTMVGVGGSIGTGLLLGSGAAIKIAGPAVIISFIVAGLITWTVTMALGEMASRHPGAGSFGLYAELYLNHWAGFVSRYAYWIGIAIAVGGELVASATYMGYWFPGVRATVWVIVFAAVLLLINLRQVGDYGWFEFWFAMVKLMTIIAFIVIGGAFLLTGRVAAQYTAHGGFFPNGKLAPALAMGFALFTFAGIEMVAISSGESKSVKEIPRAVRSTFGLLTFVYMCAIVILVGVMPWNGAGVTESPFVSVFRLARLPAASHVMNFVVLSAALSAANASLYVDSRMLFSLARDGYAPAAFGRLTGAGSPLLALLVSAVGILIAAGMEKWAPDSAYIYLISAALFGIILTWWIVLAAHISFRRRLSSADLNALPMHSPGGSALSAAGFVAMIAVMVGTWWTTRLIVISGVLYVVVLSAAFLLVKKGLQESRMKK